MPEKIELEAALAGAHGPEAKAAAEDVVKRAVEQVAKMLKTAIGALPPGVPVAGFASGGSFSAKASVPRYSGGEFVVPIRKKADRA